jgi:hypothetical protein
MRTSLVLTFPGDDKPGIVEQLSERMVATGANWEESRMARLAGKFAGLLRPSVDEDRADTLRQLQSGGLKAVVERSGETSPRGDDLRPVAQCSRGARRRNHGGRRARRRTCRDELNLGSDREKSDDSGPDPTGSRLRNSTEPVSTEPVTDDTTVAVNVTC